MFYNKIMAQYMRDECRKILVQSLKHIKKHSAKFMRT